jgi:Spy/CpxP family protein refolding chaperone
MTFSMTPLRGRRQLAAAVLALLAGTAFAQATTPAPTPAASSAHRQAKGHGEMHERHGHHGRSYDSAKMQKRYDQRMAELKKSLQITPAQEPAWTEFSNAVRPPATAPQMPDRAAMEKMTTPQRLDQMQAMRKQHMAQMDQREAATRAFYSRLSAEQQKRFDEQGRRMGHGGEHHRDGHHGHEEHGGQRHHR